MAVRGFFDDQLSDAEKFIASAMLAAAKRGNVASGSSILSETRIWSVKILGTLHRTTVTVQDMQRLLAWDRSRSNPRDHRAASAAFVCFAALLRVSEAASLRWEDLKQSGSFIEVRVRHAKNDQLDRGRSTFVDGTTTGPVTEALNRWKDNGGASSAFCFGSLLDGRQLNERHLAKEVRTGAQVVSKGCVKCGGRLS
jgi:integrase